MGLLKVKVSKNSFEDAFFIMIFLFAAAILLLVVYKVWTEINNPIADALISATDGKVNITSNFNMVTSTLAMFDKLFPLLVIGVIGFVFVSASLVMKHPIGIFIGIILMAVAVFLGMIYSNIYHNISSTTTFEEANSVFSITELFMKFLPVIIVLAIVIISASIMWARTANAGGAL